MTASFKYADRLDFQAAENSRTLLATARPQLSAPAPARPRTPARTLSPWFLVDKRFSLSSKSPVAGESRSQRCVRRVTISWSTSEPSTQINYWTEILGYCGGLWAGQSSVRQPAVSHSNQWPTVRNCHLPIVESVKTFYGSYLRLCFLIIMFLKKYCVVQYYFISFFLFFTCDWHLYVLFYGNKRVVYSLLVYCRGPAASNERVLLEERHNKNSSTFNVSLSWYV